MKKKLGLLVIPLSVIMIVAMSSVVVADIRTATFDNIVTGTNLDGYTENNLIVSTPSNAYMAYEANNFPSISPAHPGFSGGFFYPYGGVTAPITIKTSDSAEIYDLKFNAGSGWYGYDDVYLVWQIWDDGLVVSSNKLTVPKGTQVDFAYIDGFDYLLVAGTQSASGNITDFQALALDNLIANTAPGGSVPEPATMLLVGLGLVGLAGIRRKLS